MKAKHAELQNIGLRWLHGNGCSVLAKEVPTRNGIADALGIRTRDKETVYYLEAKASRADLVCKKQKDIYQESVGQIEKKCYRHQYNPTLYAGVWEAQKDCLDCSRLNSVRSDTGIDYYYLIVADGVKVEDTLYPAWGVISEEGTVIRRAKRMPRNGDIKETLIALAHVLVYKAYGKLYFGEFTP